MSPSRIHLEGRPRRRIPPRMPPRKPPTMPPIRKAEKGKKVATESDGVGSIEVLPDVVLKHILGLLPAQEAVRTCVLSRRWRDLWISATTLRISGIKHMNKLRKFVDHLLLLRGDAPLDTCVLRFCSAIANVFSDDDTTRVNLWFRHAMRCQARVIQLHVNSSNYYFDLDGLRPVSQHLVVLNLFGLYIKEESFLQFSSCPSLEKLLLKACDLTFATKISSESLKLLSITSCVFSETSRTCIAAPCLTSFKLNNNMHNTPVVENMPKIVNVFIRITNPNVDNCFYCSSGQYYMCTDKMHKNDESVLLEGLSKAKNLTLIAESKTFIFKRDLKRHPTFSNLKTLLLRDPLCVALDLKALTCILKHSPLLEKLTLELFLEDPGDKVEMKGSFYPGQRSAEISEHLKMVVVKCKVVDRRVSEVLKLLCTFNICFRFE